MGRKLEISPGRHHRMNKHPHRGGFFGENGGCTIANEAQSPPPCRKTILTLNAASSTPKRRKHLRLSYP
ncbi:hypothetical protein BDQ94DRAFT_146019, partial [Aspergillus welwitschiae]